MGQPGGVQALAARQAATCGAPRQRKMPPCQHVAARQTPAPAAGRSVPPGLLPTLPRPPARLQRQAEAGSPAAPRQGSPQEGRRQARWQEEVTAGGRGRLCT